MQRLTGSLQVMTETEDTVLYVYRPDRHPVRGAIYLVLAAVLLALGFWTGVRLGRWYSWFVALLPLATAAVSANWGLADLIVRPLFQLEIDRRARTLALAMATAGGQALTKVTFNDVASVEISGKRDGEGLRARRSWNVTLLLKDGRRIGLGLSGTRAKADEVAGRFSTLTGAAITGESG